MKRREISATGIINAHGALAMCMGELNQFFAMHKGCRVIARFTIAQKGTSEALKGYYFNYVVPTFKAAIWDAGERITEQETERRLREISPIMQEESVNTDTGEYSTRLRTIPELSNAELVEHIAFLQEYGAENYSIYIDDPTTL